MMSVWGECVQIPSFFRIEAFNRRLIDDFISVLNFAPVCPTTEECAQWKLIYFENFQHFNRLFRWQCSRFTSKCHTEIPHRCLSRMVLFMHVRRISEEKIAYFSSRITTETTPKLESHLKIPVSLPFDNISNHKMSQQTTNNTKRRDEQAIGKPFVVLWLKSGTECSLEILLTFRISISNIELYKARW